MLSYILVKQNPTEGDISKARFSGAKLNQEKHWHIGQQAPEIPDGFKVVEVHADGDELDYLLDNLTNIPLSKSPVVKWYGDMAMFVIGNMPFNKTWDKVNQRTVRLK